MKKLKRMIVEYLIKVNLLLVAVLLIVSIIAQIFNEQQNAMLNADIIFSQIEHILNDNNRELADTKEEYRQTCLKNAEAIAYIIQYHPEALESIDELKKIAEFTGVDEIHIFSKDGEIVNGTHPEYYGYTFDSGEQIGFFKPMLENKSLTLCQDITPNTAENKMMQYSALWSENEEFIVQVGMEPASVMKVMEKNELSFIFSMLRVNPGVGFFAIDKETGEIIGTTDETTLGMHYKDIGINQPQLLDDKDGFHANINGTSSYCIFKEIDGNYVGRILPLENMYGRIPGTTLLLAFSLIIVVIILVVSVSLYMNKIVVNSIDKVNRKLRSITDGNLDKTVNVDVSVEFVELSKYINDMVQSLLASTEKMSYILNQVDMHIGVYEYNEHMKNVRYTDYITDFLSLDNEDSKKLTIDYPTFKKHMDKLRANPVPNEKNVYLIEGESDIYVRVAENTSNGDILGMIIDVTNSIIRRRQIEAERDMDILTGLYNRRGIESRLLELFKTPEKLKVSSIIMIDADGLKYINDMYGHEKGDLYLKGVAEVLNELDMNKCIAARQGGDEFVVFLYNYDTKEELLKDIEKLQGAQDGKIINLSSKLSVPLKFSLGFCLTEGQTDYESMLKLADEKMYLNKTERKKRS